MIEKIKIIIYHTFLLVSIILLLIPRFDGNDIVSLLIYGFINIVMIAWHLFFIFVVLDRYSYLEE